MTTQRWMLAAAVAALFLESADELIQMNVQA